MMFLWEIAGTTASTESTVSNSSTDGWTSIAYDNFDSDEPTAEPPKTRRVYLDEFNPDLAWRVKRKMVWNEAIQEYVAIGNDPLPRAPRKIGTPKWEPKTERRPR